jgi:hypothetical protein
MMHEGRTLRLAEIIQSANRNGSTMNLLISALAAPCAPERGPQKGTMS